MNNRRFLPAEDPGQLESLSAFELSADHVRIFMRGARSEARALVNGEVLEGEDVMALIAKRVEGARRVQVVQETEPPQGDDPVNNFRREYGHVFHARDTSAVMKQKSWPR